MEMVFIEIKRRMNYRTEVYFTFFASLVEIAVQIALWRYLYQNNNEMMNFMTVYVIYSSIIKAFYSNRIFYILTEKIQSGDFIIDLLKPVNIVWFSYLKSLGEIICQIILEGFPLLLLFSTIVVKNTIWTNLGLALSVLLAGHIIFTLIYTIIGFSSFMFVESWSLRRLMDDTIHFISGAMFPIAIFPDILQKIAMVLPFRYMYDLPINLLVNQNLDEVITHSDYIGIMLWIVILSIVLLVVYNNSVHHSVVQGG